MKGGGLRLSNFRDDKRAETVKLKDGGYLGNLGLQTLDCAHAGNDRCLMLGSGLGQREKSSLESLDGIKDERNREPSRRVTKAGAQIAR